MKKLALLLLGMILFFSGNAIAQGKASASIATVTQNGATVDFTITASKPFIVGNNRYILHVGDKVFTLNKQSSPGGKGKITFFIPSEDFESLTEGSGIYLTYGHITGTEQDMESSAKQNYGQCWSFGKFSKNLLTK